MKQVKAYEYDGKLYKTPEEALKQEFYDDLTSVFANYDWKENIKRIVNRKDIQDELVELITKHQEELNGNIHEGEVQE